MSEQPADTFIEPLTNREQDILKLLAEGLSNQEIAERLTFELGTVKWYNNQIYGKLQAKNRKEAVQRAQMLGLLEVDTADPLHRPQHNLPADTLLFVGRGREIAELSQQVASDKIRLVTILGPGGMGKTRLSIEVARRFVGQFADGVYFVPLAAVTSTEHMVTAIAETVGFKFYSDAQPDRQLLDHFKAQHLLLVIDNFEHLVENAALLSAVLAVAPGVKMLVTSREKLGLGGEAVYVLGGLSTADEDDAVALFAEAARRTASPVADADLGMAARICRMVGAMPLAILLAAAWTDTLWLAEIEAEIGRGLGVLETTQRDAPQRHRSIEAVFDASWARLSADEQRIFAALAVFRDGFTRQAAQDIAGASIRDVQRLVHTSFVQHLPSGRYAIHELMRQYGEAKLAESGDIEAVRAKHAAFFAALVAPLAEQVWLNLPLDLLAVINADAENIRAVLSAYVETRDIAGLRRYLESVWYFYDAYSRSQEFIELCEMIQDAFRDEHGDEAIMLRGQLLVLLGWFYGDIGLKAKALELSEQGIRVLEPFGTAKPLLQGYIGACIMLHFLNRPLDALVVLNTGFDLSRETDEHVWRPLFYQFIGSTYYDLGQHEEAAKWLPGPTGPSLIQRGDYAEAEKVLLATLEANGPSRYGNIHVYCHLIDNAVLSKRHEQAWFYLHRGLRYADDRAYAWGALETLGYALSLFAAEEQDEFAVEVLSLILHHSATMELTRAQVARHEDRLRASLPVDVFAAAWERGKRRDLGDLLTELMER